MANILFNLRRLRSPFFYIGGSVRIAWLLLFCPSLAFAIAGCPVGVQLGSVTIATPLPVCLKFEDSQLGGCLVDCKGVCVELPLANKKGPVETTGVACNWTENGNGDGDGDDKNPDKNGNSNDRKDWDYFEPVIGDATGTSVSAAIAKLNRNLGRHISALSDNSERIYQRANEMTSLSQRTVNATESAKQLLTEISEYNRVANSRQEGMQLVATRSEHYLEQIAKNTAGGTGENGEGSQSNIESFLKSNFDQLFGKFDRAYYGAQLNVSNHTGSMLSDVASINGALGMNGIAGQIKQMNESMQNLVEVMNGGGATGGGSDIDYSQMPGSGNNPLSVGAAQYSSTCNGDNCFFDVPGMEKRLAETNKSLADKYTTITEDVKQVFSFNLAGSADPMECLELFTHQGKEYTVCPPSGDYWKTLATLMLFIFYFVALMIIFKR